MAAASPVAAAAEVKRGTWSRVEDAWLVDHAESMSYREMADELNRTQRSVEGRAYELHAAKRYTRRTRPGLSPLPKGLPPAERAVAVLLRERACEGWQVSASQLAAATGLHRRAVHRAIARLVATGLVERQRTRDEFWGFRPNSYRWVVSDTDTRGRG